MGIFPTTMNRLEISSPFEKDLMLITQLLWLTASPISLTPSKIHCNRVLSTTTITVAFFGHHYHLVLSTTASTRRVVSTTTTVAFFQPPPPSRFVDHRHVFSATPTTAVAPSSTVKKLGFGKSGIQVWVTTSCKTKSPKSM
ncbi:hypothetical protein YC2023_011224 [Brassica napus]